jgi:hypothetical protein
MNDKIHNFVIIIFLCSRDGVISNDWIFLCSNEIESTNVLISFEYFYEGKVNIDVKRRKREIKLQGGSLFLYLDDGGRWKHESFYDAMLMRLTGMMTFKEYFWVSSSSSKENMRFFFKGDVAKKKSWRLHCYVQISGSFKVQQLLAFVISTRVTFSTAATFPQTFFKLLWFLNFEVSLKEAENFQRSVEQL